MGTVDKDYPRISEIRRDLENVNEKISIVDAKVDALNQGLYPVPDRIVEMNTDMSMRAQKIAELEEKNQIHSAKLRLLQKEITYVKTENELLKEQFSPRGENPGRNGMAHNYNDDQRGAGSRMADANKPTNVYPDSHQLKPQQYMDDGPQQRNGQDSYRDDPNQKKFDDLKYKVDAGVNDKAKQEYDYEEIQRERRRQIYGMHDATAINPHRWEEKPKHRKFPWYDHKTHPYPGGFLFLRFDDSGFNIADNALKKQQSICRHTGGYLMGMARKDRIFIYESAPSKQMNWNFSKVQQYRDVTTTENAMAVFWFTSRDAAESFFGNTHKNPFREPCFPTANGYEAFYVPLCSPPTKTLNTFLFIEFLNAHKYDAENMTNFEAEVRRDMSRVCPGCDPMDVSSQTGRVVFKPGLLISPHSKLFISRFESQRDTDQIWKLGMIQALRQKYGLTGEMNVYSLSIDVAM